jgi:hypothetical protein
MVLSGKHNRNDRLGQSLFSQRQAPVALLCLMEEVGGRLFCSTTSVGAGGVKKSIVSRGHAIIGACRGDHHL